MSFQNILFDLFILMLFAAAVYALLFLPRQREFRQRQKLVSELQPGSEVVTYGGLIGKVRQVDSQNGVVTLEVAEGVEVRFVAAAIASEFDAQAIAESAQKALK